MRKINFPDNYPDEERERLDSLIRVLLAHPINFHSIFAAICDDLEAGLMLSQLWYWRDSKTAIERDGWVYKTRSEWESEAYLSKFQQVRARRILRDKRFIQESFHDNPPKLYFKVNFRIVTDAIVAYSDEQQKIQGVRKWTVKKLTRKGSETNPLRKGKKLTR